MELILVRHSITPGNLERRFVGTTDQPLAPEGIELAREIACQIPPVEHVYISPMIRCLQTADHLWPGIGRTVIDDLRETNFGPFEGKSHAELAGDPVYQRWLRGEIEPGEPIECCNDRASAALARIAEDCRAKGWRTAGVLAHGGLFMGMLSRHGSPAREYYDWLPPNCGGYRAELCVKPLGLRVTGTVGRTRE